MKLGLSQGTSRLSPTIKRKRIAWEILRDRLLKIPRTTETYAAYMAMSREKLSQGGEE